MSRPGIALVIVIATGMGGAAFANEAHNMLNGLTPSKRNGVMTDLMRSSGERCQVERTLFQGNDKRGAAFWSVGCAGGKAHSVMINNDSTGSTRILDCKTLRTVAGVDCFKSF